MICEVCKKNPGVMHEHEFRTRRRRTLICFCEICLHMIESKDIRAPAYISNEQVVRYILAKEKQDA